MISMDDILVGVRHMASAAEWSEERATQLTTSVADGLGLWIQYEPGDEEWAILQGDGPYLGMISVRLPIAVVTARLADFIAKEAPEVRSVVIEDFFAETLRASPELLRATVLPYGWDPDFDTEAFSANDLFVESV